MKTNRMELKASLWIVVASLLWAADTVLRYPTTEVIDPLVVVFSEHVLGLAVILPWVLLRHRHDAFNLRGKEWLCALVISVGGAAVAGILYTASIHAIGTSVPILVEKLQPLFVVIMATWLLKEKLTANLFPWSVVAVFSAVILTYPDLSFTSQESKSYGTGILYAFGAMALWAASTIAGKYLLYRRSASIGVFWRYLGACVFLAVMIGIDRDPIPWKLLATGPVLRPILYMGTLGGSISFLLYYQGLKKLPASIATFLELIYPLAGAILSAMILGSEMSFMQLMAAALLFLSIVLMVIPKGQVETLT